MESYFKIKLVRPIKPITETLNSIMFISIIGIIFFIFFLMPSHRTPGELKVLFFERVLPVWMQYSIVLSIFIFPAAILLKRVSTYNSKGVIKFSEDAVRIKLWHKTIDLKVHDLTKIIFVEHESFINPIMAFRFIIQTKQNEIYKFKLIELNRWDELKELVVYYATDRLKIVEVGIESDEIIL